MTEMHLETMICGFYQSPQFAYYLIETNLKSPSRFNKCANVLICFGPLSGPNYYCKKEAGIQTFWLATQLLIIKALSAEPNLLVLLNHKLRAH